MAKRAKIPACTRRTRPKAIWNRNEKLNQNLGEKWNSQMREETCEIRSKRREFHTKALALISRHAISGRNAREARTDGRTASARLHLELHASRRARLVCSRVLRPTSTGGVQSEDTLLLPSESEAPMVRRPEGVSGSVAMAIRWDCHGVQPGISTLLPLFRDSLSSPLFLQATLLAPPSLFLSATSALPPLSLSLSYSRYGRRLRFSPPYTYVFTRLPSRPLVPSSPPFVGPFASFVPRLTPYQRRQRWLAGWLAGGLFFSAARLF